jgi:hypothetical protein
MKRILAANSIFSTVCLSTLCILWTITGFHRWTFTLFFMVFGFLFPIFLLEGLIVHYISRRSRKRPVLIATVASAALPMVLLMLVLSIWSLILLDADVFEFFTYFWFRHLIVSIVAAFTIGLPNGLLIWNCRKRNLEHQYSIPSRRTFTAACCLVALATILSVGPFLLWRNEYRKLGDVQWWATSSRTEQLETMHFLLQCPIGDHHDVFLTLKHIGTPESIPYLISALRWYDDTWVCTKRHCLDALKKITGHDAGESYAEWHDWWSEQGRYIPQDAFPLGHTGIPGTPIHNSERPDESISLDPLNSVAGIMLFSLHS